MQGDAIAGASAAATPTTGINGGPAGPLLITNSSHHRSVPPDAAEPAVNGTANGVATASSPTQLTTSSSFSAGVQPLSAISQNYHHHHLGRTHLTAPPKAVTPSSPALGRPRATPPSFGALSRRSRIDQNREPAAQAAWKSGRFQVSTVQLELDGTVAAHAGI